LKNREFSLHGDEGWGFIEARHAQVLFGDTEFQEASLGNIRKCKPMVLLAFQAEAN
jgi:hypothetical protein